MKLFLRLTSEIDNGLRTLLRHRGDLSRFIEEALTTADLNRVALLSPCAWNGKGTTASIDKRTGERQICGKLSRMLRKLAGQQRDRGLARQKMRSGILDDV